jgi:hypothetical protein
MTDQSHVRQSSPSTATRNASNRPHRTADRMSLAGRRDLAVLLASGVAISTWALFPSTVESGIYVPLPAAAAPSAADVKLADEDAIASPVNAFRLINAELAPSKPTTHGLVTTRYSSPALYVRVVPLRAKLQALLNLLYSQSGDVDWAALEEKLQALLTLPDSVLAQLIEHPDLAQLNKMLDAVLLGTSDLSGVKTELDKIDVASVPGSSEQIDVVKINGKPAYVVRSHAGVQASDNAAGSPAPAPAPSEPVTVTTVNQVEAPADLTATAFAAPSREPLPPALAPISQIAFSFAGAPSTEPPSTPSASPTPSASVEPTGTSQTAQDIMTSGNMFEPGETVAQPSGSDSSPTATASTSPTGQESPAEPGDVTSGGGVAPPSNNEGGDPSSPSAGDASP